MKYYVHKTSFKDEIRFVAINEKGDVFAVRDASASLCTRSMQTVESFIRLGLWVEIDEAAAQLLCPKYFKSPLTVKTFQPYDYIGVQPEEEKKEKPAQLVIPENLIQAIRWLALNDKTGEHSVSQLLDLVNEYQAND